MNTSVRDRLTTHKMLYKRQARLLAHIEPRNHTVQLQSPSCQARPRNMVKGYQMQNRLPPQRSAQVMQHSDHAMKPRRPSSKFRSETRDVFLALLLNQKLNDIKSAPMNQTQNKTSHRLSQRRHSNSRCRSRQKDLLHPQVRRATRIRQFQRVFQSATRLLKLHCKTYSQRKEDV